MGLLEGKGMLNSFKLRNGIIRFVFRKANLDALIRAGWGPRGGKNGSRKTNWLLQQSRKKGKNSFGNRRVSKA